MDEPKLTPIAVDEPFQFGCHPGVTCFNACCSDLNQFLTPYDILRLAHHLQMAAAQFLETYTSLHTGPQTGLPVVSLKPASSDVKQCPFVTPDGCRVYSHRPSSCRLYPLARMVTRNPRSGDTVAHYAVLQESHCCGFHQPENRTAQEWIGSQALGPYFSINDLFLEIIHLKNRHRPGHLDSDGMKLVYDTLYDLDAFRRHLSSGGGNAYQASGSSAVAQRLAGDHPKEIAADVALLQYAHQWLKEQLFGV